MNVIELQEILVSCRYLSRDFYISVSLVNSADQQSVVNYSGIIKAIWTV